MPLSKKEMKALMTAEAEAIIDDLLASRDAADLMTLTDIEEAVLVAGRRIQAVLTQALVEAEEAKGSRPQCPECGAMMRHRGYREKQMVTRTGEVKVRRAYYRCPTCGRGLFPPGQAVGAQAREL
jgi:uncharacterized protein with PIN domain